MYAAVLLTSRYSSVHLIILQYHLVQVLQYNVASVTAAPAAYLEVKLIVLHHPLSQRRNVDSSITFSCEEQLVLAVFGEQLKELLQS